MAQAGHIDLDHVAEALCGVDEIAKEMLQTSLDGYRGPGLALVIGNGPSTKELDFIQAERPSLLTVGMNSAYRYWRKIDFRPTHYICMDSTVILSHAKEIYSLVKEGRIKKFFLRDEIKTIYPDLAGENNILWFEYARGNIELFKTNFITTGSWAIRWMVHEGAGTIASIGIDANYVEVIPAAKVVEGSKIELEIAATPTQNPNYFFEGYQQAGDKYNIPNDPEYMKETGRLVHVDALQRAKDDIERLRDDVVIWDLSTISTHGIFQKQSLEDFLCYTNSTMITSFHANTSQDLIKMNVLMACVNAVNPEIGSISILFEGTEEQLTHPLSGVLRAALSDLRQAARITVLLTRGRPNYNELFSSACGEGTNGLAIVANSDIIISAALVQKSRQKAILGWKGVFALTRWNKTKKGFYLQGLASSPPWPMLEVEQLSNLERNFFSFDTYIVTLPFGIPESFSDIDLGTLGCDTALVAASKAGDIYVSNPCLDYRTFHYDDKQRVYDNEESGASLRKNIAACRSAVLEKYANDTDALRIFNEAGRLNRTGAWIGHPQSIDFWHALFRALGATPWTTFDQPWKLAFVDMKLHYEDVLHSKWDPTPLCEQLDREHIFVKWELLGAEKNCHLFDLFRQTPRYKVLLDKIQKYQWQSFLNTAIEYSEIRDIYYRLLSLVESMLLKSQEPQSPLQKPARKPVVTFDGLQLLGSVADSPEGFVLNPPHSKNAVGLVYFGGLQRNDRVSGTLSIRVKNPSRLEIMICRHGSGKFEGSSVDVTLLPGLHSIPLSHKFAFRQLGFRVQIGALEAAAIVSQPEFSFASDSVVGIKKKEFAAAASLGQSEKRDIFISIDPDAIDHWGHFLSYDLRVGEVALAANYKFFILANRKNKIDRLEPSGEVLGVFSKNSWNTGNVNKPDMALIEEFYVELRDALISIKQKEEGRIFLYFYCGSLHHVSVFDRLIKENYIHRANINLFWTPLVKYKDQAYIERWRPELDRATRNKALTITVPTKRLQNYIEQLYQHKLPVAPHPSTTFSDESARNRRLMLRTLPARPTVLFPGGARVEKGFIRTLESAHALSSEVRCIIRAVKLESAAEAIRSRLTALDLARVEFDNSEMDNAQFIDFLAKGDLIVLPYTGEAFAERTSGLLIDAMLLGIPVVVLKGTWLSDFVERTRMGVVVEDTTESVIGGVQRVLSNFAQFSSAAQAAIEDYLRGNSWAALVDSITGGAVNQDGNDAGRKIVSLNARILPELNSALNESAAPVPAEVVTVPENQDDGVQSRTLQSRIVDRRAVGAFIIGNGPSLANLDLRRLTGRESFGMNAAYRHWDAIGWYPTHYACLDEVVGLSHLDPIARLIANADVYGIRKFLLRRNLISALGPLGRWPTVVDFDALRDGDARFAREPLTTGSHTAIWAASLGFSPLVLLGVDADYVELVPGAERREDNVLEIVRAGGNPNYFFDGYQQPGDRYHVPNIGGPAHLHSWLGAAGVLAEMGIVAYNASPRSQVQAFEFCDLEQVVQGRPIEPVSAYHVFRQRRRPLSLPVGAGGAGGSS